MGDVTAWLASLNLGPANTVLLIVILIVLKRKFYQVETLWEWYLVQRHHEDKENS